MPSGAIGTTCYNFPLTSYLEFSCTTDGSATWSAPVVVDQPGPNAFDISSEVLVLPDDTLLTVFSRAVVNLDDFSLRGELYASRSLDEDEPGLLRFRSSLSRSSRSSIPKPARSYRAKTTAFTAPRSLPTEPSTSLGTATPLQHRERSTSPSRATADSAGAGRQSSPASAPLPSSRRSQSTLMARTASPGTTTATTIPVTRR